MIDNDFLRIVVRMNQKSPRNIVFDGPFEDHEKAVILSLMTEKYGAKELALNEFNGWYIESLNPNVFACKFRMKRYTWEHGWITGDTIFELALNWLRYEGRHIYEYEAQRYNVLSVDSTGLTVVQLVDKIAEIIGSPLLAFAAGDGEMLTIGIRVALDTVQPPVSEYNLIMKSDETPPHLAALTESIDFNGVAYYAELFAVGFARRSPFMFCRRVLKVTG